MSHIEHQKIAPEKPPKSYKADVSSGDACDPTKHAVESQNEKIFYTSFIKNTISFHKMLKGDKKMKKILLTKKQATLLALVIALIATNVTFAVVYFTKNVTITGGVKTSGQIEVYEADGVTIKNTLAFEDFYAGTSDSDTEYFMIKNLGTVTVYVYWEITAPTGWIVSGNKYSFDEDITTKYYLTINKQPAAGIWQPKGGSAPDDTKIQIPASGSTQLSMDLLYTGTPATTDSLSLTVSFTAENG